MLLYNVPIQAQDNSDDAQICAAAEEYFYEHSGFFDRGTMLFSPDSSQRLVTTVDPAVAEISYKTYGSLHCAVLVVRRILTLDGSTLPREIREGIFNASEGEHAFLAGLSPVQSENDHRRMVFESYFTLTAFKLRSGWKIFRIPPFLRDPEAHKDFTGEIVRLQNGYKAL
jgi:hypothetical protein